MDALTIAVISYFVAIIISFFVAGLIQTMGSVLSFFSRSQVSGKKGNGVVTLDAPEVVSDDAAIAAVIAIAKNKLD